MREPDGLALSSRNARLSPAERALAPQFHARLGRRLQRRRRPRATRGGRLSRSTTSRTEIGRRLGAVRLGADPTHRQCPARLTSSSCSRGSIACYKACTVDLAPRAGGRDGADRRDPGRAALCRRRHARRAERPAGFQRSLGAGRALDHIELARAADLALVCPATANTVNRLAAGSGRRSDRRAVSRVGVETKAVVDRARDESPHVGTSRRPSLRWKNCATWGVRVLDPVDGSARVRRGRGGPAGSSPSKSPRRCSRRWRTK